MFHCHICNILAYNEVLDKHLHGESRYKISLLSSHITQYKLLCEGEERGITKYIINNEIDLNSRTAVELLEIYEVVKE